MNVGTNGSAVSTAVLVPEIIGRWKSVRNATDKSTSNVCWSLLRGNEISLAGIGRSAESLEMEIFLKSIIFFNDSSCGVSSVLAAEVLTALLEVISLGMTNVFGLFDRYEVSVCAAAVPLLEVKFNRGTDIGLPNRLCSIFDFCR